MTEIDGSLSSVWKEASGSLLNGRRVSTTSGLPGITELRSVSEEFAKRPVWARQDDVEHPVVVDDVKISPRSRIRKSIACLNPLNTTPERSQKTNPAWCRIRFGSCQERFIHEAMRILALVELCGVTFIISFDVVYPLRRSIAVITADTLFTSLFLLGVAARFNTSFVGPRDNIEILDKEEIKRILFGTWTLWLDAAALLAAPFLYCTSLVQILAMLRLLKCWRIPRSFRRSILLENQNLHSFHDQMFVAIGIFVATHLYACIWFQAKVMSPPGYGHEWSAWNGWSVDVFQIDSVDEGALSIPLEFGTLSDLYFCYARAFRDGAYMLISWNGPNAISALELVTIGILSPISGLIMAYVYALFVSSIEQSRMLEKQFIERLAVLGDACKDMYLPQDLRDRILRYHSFLSMHHLGAESQDLFQQLSANLTCEMRMFRMRNVICSANFFEGLSHRLVLLLVQTFVEQAFAPGDMVVRKGEVADCMYIILRGAVTVLSDDDASKVVTKMQDGSVFGELCFVQEQMTRTAWIRAETYLVVWRFDKANFEALLDTHDDARITMVDHITNRVKDFVDFQNTETWSRRVSSILEGSEEMLELKSRFAEGFTPQNSLVNRLSSMSERSEEDSSSSGLSSGEMTPLMAHSDRSSRQEAPPPAQNGYTAAKPSTPSGKDGQSSESSSRDPMKRRKSVKATVKGVERVERKDKRQLSAPSPRPTISLSGHQASAMRRSSFHDVKARISWGSTTEEANPFHANGILNEDRALASKAQQLSTFGLDEPSSPSDPRYKKRASFIDRRPSIASSHADRRPSIADIAAAAAAMSGVADSNSSRPDPNLDPNAPKVNGSAVLDHMRRRKSIDLMTSLADLEQQQKEAEMQRKEAEKANISEATHKKVLELEDRVDKLGRTLQNDLASQKTLLLNLASQLARIEAKIPGPGADVTSFGVTSSTIEVVPPALSARSSADATNSSVTAASSTLGGVLHESKAISATSGDLAAELLSETTAAVTAGSGRQKDSHESMSACESASVSKLAAENQLPVIADEVVTGLPAA